MISAEHFSLELADRLPQAEHALVGEAVVDGGARPARLDEPAAAQRLQVLGGVGHRQAGLAGELVHAPLALREQLDELEAVRVGERLGHARELFEERTLDVRMMHLHTQ